MRKNLDGELLEWLPVAAQVRAALAAGEIPTKKGHAIRFTGAQNIRQREIQVRSGRDREPEVVILSATKGLVAYLQEVTAIRGSGKVQPFASAGDFQFFAAAVCDRQIWHQP